jgi:formylglycine-generating enzyme required for sulfatase activity
MPKHEAMIEVAHEALFSAWPDLADWIGKRREALIRKPQVLRDAARWDAEDRPDKRLYKPDIVDEMRRLLEAAEVWRDMARDDARVAHFLTRDDADELLTLTRRAFEAGAAGESGAVRLQLLRTLTTEGRSAETVQAVGETINKTSAAITDWLREGLDALLQLLGVPGKPNHWHARRVRIGDLMAALGDVRAGVGLRGDGLPDIAWESVRAGRCVAPNGETRRTNNFSIARYPVTNVQYEAFCQAPDYSSPKWWVPGYPPSSVTVHPWSQVNRPRIMVSLYEAVACCRWLTSAYHRSKLIEPTEEIRLPTEYEWIRSARGRSRRDFPWGNNYISGDANVDETLDNSGRLSMKETVAVGLFPRNTSLFGAMDCSGNVWEMCDSLFSNPDIPSCGMQELRVLRGGCWVNEVAYSRLDERVPLRPDLQDSGYGFRVVRALRRSPLYTGLI